MYIPKIGNRFYFDGVNWIVVGVGDTPFEYRADKGIFAIVDLNKMDCLLVIIKEKEVKISIDPSIPSVKADGNELLKIYGDKGTYVLLEFDEKNN